MPSVGVQLKDAAGATIGHTVTDASGLYLFDRLPAGTYSVCFEVGDAPVGLRAHHEGRARLDARQRLRRGRQRLHRQHDARRRASATWIGTPASGRRRLRLPAASGRRLHAAPSPGKPKLALTKLGKPATVQAGENVRYTLVVKNVGKAHRAQREGLRHAPGRRHGHLDRRRQALGRRGLLDGGHARQGQAASSSRSTVKVDLTTRKRITNKAVATASDAPSARAASSTNITLPKPRSGVAGVTG